MNKTIQIAYRSQLVAKACSLLSWAVMLGTFVASATVQAEQSPDNENTTPYWAVVNVDQAPVLSGPGPHYYATAELPRRARVEVYREGTNGFNAIRPPEGSFSWLRASAAKPNGSGMAIVTQGNVGSRIGSLLSQRRDAVHVRLDQGEQLQLLATEKVNGVEWLQVAPPAGEFRWIRAEYLTPESELPKPAPLPQTVSQDNTRVNERVNELADQPSSLQAIVPPVASVPATANQNNEPVSVWSKMSATTPGGSNAESHAAEPQASPLLDASSRGETIRIDPEVQLTAGVAPSWQSPGTSTGTMTGAPLTSTSAPALASEKASGASATPNQPYPTATPPGASTFWRQLALVDVELSRRVTTTPNLWQFRDLEQQAARLLQSATDLKQQQAVQQLGVRIDRFAAIANRHRMVNQQPAMPPTRTPTTNPAPITTATLAAGQTTAPPVSSSPSPQQRPSLQQPSSQRSSSQQPSPQQAAPSNIAITSTLAPRAVSPSPEASPYDSVGILRPVVSKRPNAPSYALVNEQGQVTVFLTPSPDLNLSAMVGKKVGVNGSRGYIREFQREHLTATRVSPVTTLR